MPKVRTLYRANLITRKIEEVQAERRYRNVMLTPTGYIYDQGTNGALLETYSAAVAYLEKALELEIEAAEAELQRRRQELVAFRTEHLGFSPYQHIHSDQANGLQPN